MTKSGIRNLSLLLILVVFGTSTLAAEFGDVQIHGFVSQGYVVSNQYDYFSLSTEDGTFEYNEYGVNFLSSLPNNVQVGMQLLARDYGEFGNGKIAVDWVQGEYYYRDWLSFRIGKVKKAMGLYNQSRDIDIARTSIFLPSSVYPELLRNQQMSIVGGSVFGGLPGGFEYQLQYGTLDSGLEEFSLQRESLVEAVNFKHSATFALTWNSPLEGLRLVGSLSQYEFDKVLSTGETRTFEYLEPTIGAEYSNGLFTVAAEYRQTQNKSVSDTDASRNQEKTSDGFYWLGNYRLNQKLELGSSYAVTYRDIDNRDGDGQTVPSSLWLKDFAVSARFDVTSYWVLKAEAHYMKGFYTVSGYDRTDPDINENATLLAFKSTFRF